MKVEFITQFADDVIYDLIKKSIAIWRGRPVLSAGEIEMTSNGKGGYYGFGLNTDSGHFLNAATSIEN